MLLLIKKHTDTFYEQTKTKPQEKLENKLKKQKETFSFNPPLNLFQKRQWLLAVTSFGGTNFVFNLTDENNSFLISTPGHWNSEDDEKLFYQSNKLLEFGRKTILSYTLKKLLEVLE